MKFITTKENPIFKKGIDLSIDNQINVMSVQYVGAQEKIYLGQDTFIKWRNLGYFKEVEEKEFTKSDMKSYGTYASGVIWSQNTNRENIFNNWSKLTGHE